MDRAVTSGNTWARCVSVALALSLASVLSVLPACAPSTDSPPQESTETASKAQNTVTEASPSADATDIESPKDRPKTASAVRTTPARVSRVIDGDTIEVRLEDGGTEKVRLIGVDTPEDTTKVEPYGAEATAFTRRVLLGERVYLEGDAEARDRYRRRLAYVWLEAPQSVSDREIRAKLFNARLLLEGYANLMTIPPNVKYVDFLKTYQADARDADKGLWALPAKPRAPSSKSGSSQGGAFKDYGEPDGEYVGNSNTGKFHYTWCRYASKIEPSNRVRLDSREKAVAAGFVPCKVCDP